MRSLTKAQAFYIKPLKNIEADTVIRVSTSAMK